MLRHQVIKSFPPVCPEDLTSPVFAVGVAAGAFFFRQKTSKLKKHPTPTRVGGGFINATLWLWGFRPEGFTNATLGL